MPHNDPSGDLLPVTDDLLLSEEQVRELIGLEAAQASLDQAVLQQGAALPVPPPPPPPVPQIQDMPAAPQAAPARTVVRRVVVPARSQNNAAPYLIMAAVVLLAGGGAAWWILQKRLPPAEIAEASPPASPAATAPSTAPDAPAPAVKESTAAHTASAIAKGAPTAVRANPVIAAELFDYKKSDPLGGMEGGLGWAGPWTAPQTVIESASLIGGLPAAAGPGGHAVLTAAPQVTVSRAFASPPWDAEKGGDWWTSLLISLPAGDAAENAELWCNLQSAAHINPVIRLTLTQKGSTFTLTGTGAAKPLTLPWEAGAPIQFVAHTTASPAGTAGLDWRTELWLNPLPDQLIKGSVKPDLVLSAKAAPLPATAGISFQKPSRKTAGSIRIDDILVAKSAASVVH